MKVVINRCYGGFSLSQKALEYLDEAVGPRHIDTMDIADNRSEPYLVETVAALGQEASGLYSRLSIVEWPENIPYKITEYDGWESVTIDLIEFMKKHMNEINNSETPLASELKEYYNHLNN